nr:aminotransferase class III-fold pyridoxal phosphate-dependent enzyme [Pseudomonas costantinii]
MEAAIKLARHYTKRSALMAFHGGYHGMTAGALSAMGNLNPKGIPNVTAQNTHFLPYPYRFRCPFGTDGEQTDQLSIDYIRTVLSDPEGGVTRPPLCSSKWCKVKAAAFPPRPSGCVDYARSPASWALC